MIYPWPIIDQKYGRKAKYDLKFSFIKSYAEETQLLPPHIHFYDLKIVETKLPFVMEILIQDKNKWVSWRNITAQFYSQFQFELEHSKKGTKVTNKSFFTKTAIMNVTVWQDGKINYNENDHISNFLNMAQAKMRHTINEAILDEK